MNADSDRFAELDRLFQEVCELPSAQWEARLMELKPDDASLRSEVMELLEAESRTKSGLTPEAIRSKLGDAFAFGLRDPAEVAGYRVIDTLGIGGMGVVYLAEQQSPRRQVALKLLRPGIATPDLVRRFQFESEALGRLRHPAIAQVYESGVATTEAGPQPYFAMELVQGRSLTEWSAGRPVRERLEMLASICDAVQHAHTRGVMHRDLKPGNIMVTDEGAPKVLDFGVARSVGAERNQDTLQTDAGQLIGTLPYMSPEQLSGDPHGADTRADTYALGVILYELLSGRTPHETSGLGLLEAAEVIRAGPGVRLATLDPKYRGDIDIMVRKALETDRERRYQTAAEFGEDIRRYLQGQTITARPASAVYQLSRVAKRHMPATIASAAALIALVGAVIGVSLALRESTLQRAEAERRASIAEAVMSFFNTDVFAAIEPNALGHEATVREALDLAAERLPGRFEDKPVTGAAIRNNIANVYHALGQFDRAAAFAIESRDAFLSELGEAHELTRFAQQDVGSIYSDMGRFDEAREALEGSLAMRERSIGRDAPETLENLVMLAELERDGFGDYASASDWLDEYDRRNADRLGDDSHISIYAEMTRGGIALAARDYETAAESYATVAEARERLYGDTHSATLTAWANLAVAYEALGRYADAEPIYLRVLEVEERMGGKDSPDRLPTAHNLAFLYQSMQRYDEAEALFLDTLERCRRVFGPFHPGTLTCVQSLVALYRDTDRLEFAVSTLEQAYEPALEQLGEDAPPVLEMAPKLGVMYTELGRVQEGEAVFARTVPVARRLLPEGHPFLGSMLSQWGVCLHRLGRSQDAIDRLIEAYGIFTRAPGAEQLSDAKRAASRLAAIYTELNDDAAAELWTSRSREQTEDAE